MTLIAPSGMALSKQTKKQACDVLDRLASTMHRDPLALSHAQALLGARDLQLLGQARCRVFHV